MIAFLHAYKLSEWLAGCRHGQVEKGIDVDLFVCLILGVSITTHHSTNDPQADLVQLQRMPPTRHSTQQQPRQGLLYHHQTKHTTAMTNMETAHTIRKVSPRLCRIQLENRKQWSGKCEIPSSHQDHIALAFDGQTDPLAIPAVNEINVKYSHSVTMPTNMEIDVWERLEETERLDRQADRQINRQTHRQMWLMNQPIKWLKKGPMNGQTERTK